MSGAKRRKKIRVPKFYVVLPQLQGLSIKLGAPTKGATVEHAETENNAKVSKKV